MSNQPPPFYYNGNTNPSPQGYGGAAPPQYPMMQPQAPIPSHQVGSGYAPPSQQHISPSGQGGYSSPYPPQNNGYPQGQQQQQTYPQPAAYATMPYPSSTPSSFSYTNNHMPPQQSFATLPHPSQPPQSQGYAPPSTPIFSNPQQQQPSYGNPQLPLQTYTPSTSTLPTTQVELRISCKNLPNLDLLSKSDPQVILFIQKKAPINGREQLVWQIVGKTEVMKNNLNPNFTTSFVLDYYFEQVQNLCFVIVDVDSQNRPELHYQDFIGSIQIHLGQLVASAKTRAFESRLSLQLPPELARLVKAHSSRPSPTATIKIAAEELSTCKQTVQLALSARNLEKKDVTLFGGSSDPFFEIQRPREDPSNPFVTVFKSEHVSKNLNPVWKETTLKMASINHGNMQKPFKIRIFDWDRDGTHDFIGEVLISMSDLISAMNDKRGLPLVNPVKAQRKGAKYQNSGHLFVNKCLIQQEMSFLDYISTGTEISLCVGIDFTGSNGNPRDPRSLHYMPPPVQQQLPNGNIVYDSPPNQYQLAISSVGSVLEAYDTDKRFPVYGFGLRMLQTNQVYHCYPVNGNFGNPEVTSISGILDAYKQFLCSGSFELYGPTNFSPLINELNKKVQAELAVAANNPQTRLDVAGLGRYHILLVMTDGLITDMDATIEAIVDASTLPISIVIVGVGNEDFTAMNILDGDGKVLRDRRGCVAERDCVQFVPMNKFPPGTQLEALARETLAEIPRQFMDWVMKRRIQPRRIPS